MALEVTPGLSLEELEREGLLLSPARAQLGGSAGAGTDVEALLTTLASAGVGPGGGEVDAGGAGASPARAAARAEAAAGRAAPRRRGSASSSARGRASPARARRDEGGRPIFPGTGASYEAAPATRTAGEASRGSFARASRAELLERLQRVNDAHESNQSFWAQRSPEAAATATVAPTTRDSPLSASATAQMTPVAGRMDRSTTQTTPSSAFKHRLAVSRTPQRASTLKDAAATLRASTPGASAARRAQEFSQDLRAWDASAARCAMDPAREYDPPRLRLAREADAVNAGTVWIPSVWTPSKASERPYEPPADKAALDEVAGRRKDEFSVTRWYTSQVRRAHVDLRVLAAGSASSSLRKKLRPDSVSRHAVHTCARGEKPLWGSSMKAEARRASFSPALAGGRIGFGFSRGGSPVRVRQPTFENAVPTTPEHLRALASTEGHELSEQSALSGLDMELDLDAADEVALASIQRGVLMRKYTRNGRGRAHARLMRVDVDGSPGAPHNILLAWRGGGRMERERTAHVASFDLASRADELTAVCRTVAGDIVVTAESTEDFAWWSKGVRAVVARARSRRTHSFDDHTLGQEIR